MSPADFGDAHAMHGRSPRIGVVKERRALFFRCGTPPWGEWVDDRQPALEAVSAGIQLGRFRSRRSAWGSGDPGTQYLSRPACGPLITGDDTDRSALNRRRPRHRPAVLLLEASPCQL